jgi:hypothetical protein
MATNRNANTGESTTSNAADNVLSRISFGVG